MSSAALSSLFSFFLKKFSKVLYIGNFFRQATPFQRLFHVELPQARQVCDRQRERQRLGLGLHSGLFHNGLHDGLPGLRRGENKDQFLLRRQRHAEEFLRQLRSGAFAWTAVPPVAPAARAASIT